MGETQGTALETETFPAEPIGMEGNERTGGCQQRGLLGLLRLNLLGSPGTPCEIPQNPQQRELGLHPPTTLCCWGDVLPGPSWSACVACPAGGAGFRMACTGPVSAADGWHFLFPALAPRLSLDTCSLESSRSGRAEHVCNPGSASLISR